MKIKYPQFTLPMLIATVFLSWCLEFSIADALANAQARFSRCTMNEIAGKYQTAYGLLACEPKNDGLHCCYGRACENKVELRPEMATGRMVGTWIYPNGKNGRVLFEINEQCQLSDGRWGIRQNNPRKMWRIFSKAEDHKAGLAKGNRSKASKSDHDSPLADAGGISAHSFGKCIKGDCKNGQGTMLSPKGNKLEGTFKNDQLNGQGIITYSNGNKLEGTFKNGKLNGQGIITYPDGTKYEGAFKNGEPNGKGTITPSSGPKLEGAFKNGEPNGKGTITPSSGPLLLDLKNVAVHAYPADLCRSDRRGDKYAEIQLDSKISRFTRERKFKDAIPEIAGAVESKCPDVARINYAIFRKGAHVGDGVLYRECNWQPYAKPDDQVRVRVSFPELPEVNVTIKQEGCGVTTWCQEKVELELIAMDYTFFIDDAGIYAPKIGKTVGAKCAVAQHVEIIGKEKDTAQKPLWRRTLERKNDWAMNDVFSGAAKRVEKKEPTDFKAVFYDFYGVSSSSLHLTPGPSGTRSETLPSPSATRPQAPTIVGGAYLPYRWNPILEPHGPTMGGVIGHSVGQAVEAAVAIGLNAQDLSSRVRQARRDWHWCYSAACPEMVGIEKEFATWLFQKDIYYAVTRSVANRAAGTDARAAAIKKLMGILEGGEGAIDGGINEGCLPQFRVWAACVGGTNPVAMLQPCGVIYSSYQKCRDFFEIDSLPITERDYKDPTSAIVAFERYLSVPPLGRNRGFELAAVKLDRYSIKALEAAAIVIEAPKVKDDPLKLKELEEKFSHLNEKYRDKKIRFLANDLADPEALGCAEKDAYMGSCWHSLIERESYTPAAKQLLSAYLTKAHASINDERKARIDSLVANLKAAHKVVYSDPYKNPLLQPYIRQINERAYLMTRNFSTKKWEQALADCAEKYPAKGRHPLSSYNVCLKPARLWKKADMLEYKHKELAEEMTLTYFPAWITTTDVEQK